MKNQAIIERKYLQSLDKKDLEDLFYTKSEVKSILSSPKNYIILAKIDNESVGCGLAKIEPTSKWNKYNKQGYLGMLYVNKEYRRKGIAKTLQDYRIKWLKSHGVKYLTTSVLSLNLPIIKLLKKRGFKSRLIHWYKEIT